MDFAVLVDQKTKRKESEKRDEYLDLAEDIQKEHGIWIKADTNCCWCVLNYPQMINKRSRGLRKKRTSKYHPDYCINKIGQNTEKSPGHLRRISVIQTPLRNHQLTLMQKKNSQKSK